MYATDIQVSKLCITIAAGVKGFTSETLLCELGS